MGWETGKSVARNLNICRVMSRQCIHINLISSIASGTDIDDNDRRTDRLHNNDVIYKLYVCVEGQCGVFCREEVKSRARL